MTPGYGGLPVPILIALLLCATRARAQNYDSTLVSAIEQKERALDAETSALWEEALRLFRELDGIRSTAESQFEIGFAAMKLGRDDLALEAFETSLGLGLEGTARPTATRFVEQHSERFARVQVNGPPGTALFVGGELRGHLPRASLVVQPGEVTVRGRDPSGRATKATLIVGAGEIAELELRFPTEPPATPKTRETREPGPTPGAVQELVVAAKTAHSPTRTLPWTLLIGGVATGVGSGILVWQAGERITDERQSLDRVCAERRKADECANTHASQREEAQRATDAIATWHGARTAGWVGVALGSVATATGVVLLSSVGSPEQGVAIAVSPAVSPEGGMFVQFGGRFR